MVITYTAYLAQEFSLAGGGLPLLLQGPGVLHSLLQVPVLQLAQLSTGRLQVLTQPEDGKSSLIHSRATQGVPSASDVR